MGRSAFGYGERIAGSHPGGHDKAATSVAVQPGWRWLASAGWTGQSSCGDWTLISFN